jgi:xanthine dehydrogenase accessory factor
MILHEAFDTADIAWIAPLASYSGPSIETSGERPDEGPYLRRIVFADGSREFIKLESSGTLTERFGEEKTPVLLFGAGHVGRALVTALAPLPFAVRWIDDRPDAFESAETLGAATAVSALPESELADAPGGSLVVVMTHSHALDLVIVAAALADPRFAYVGLIGSATKRALFERRLAEFNLPAEAIGRLVCPIGVPGISGKSPAVIAAAVAAELLLVRERLTGSPNVKTELALG